MSQRPSIVKPAIIVAAFSRTAALIRLLDSLNTAAYPSKDIRLIISIDGGGPSSVVEAAQRFVFGHGPVEVVERCENLGLRNHILWCGDQTERFGSVVVLEDDLVVDRHFYTYLQQANEFYENEPIVAGIALYSPRHNEYVDLPFEPLKDQYSGYFMQTACSWGQAWTDKQWALFRTWLNNRTPSEINGIGLLPKTVKNWPESSWKKYFCGYLAETGRYFFYPFDSYSTNCSDAGGTHIRRGTNLFQIPLRDQARSCDLLNFPRQEVANIRYDAFMESACAITTNLLSVPSEQLHVDFYGSKPRDLLRSRRFLLTTKPVDSYIWWAPLTFRPFELNLSLSPRFSSASTNRDKPGLKVFFARSTANHSKRANRFLLSQYFSYFNLFNRRFLFSYVIALFKAAMYRTKSWINRAE